jgi:hypothetical protein
MAFLDFVLYVILMVSWKPGKQAGETESQRTDRIKLEREKLFKLCAYRSAIIIIIIIIITILCQLYAPYLEIYTRNKPCF